VGAVREDFIKK